MQSALFVSALITAAFSAPQGPASDSTLKTIVANDANILYPQAVPIGDPRDCLNVVLRCYPRNSPNPFGLLQVKACFDLFGIDQCSPCAGRDYNQICNQYIPECRGDCVGNHHETQK